MLFAETEMKIKISKNKLTAITAPTGDNFYHLVHILPDFFHVYIVSKCALRHIFLSPIVLHFSSMCIILYSVYIHISLLPFSHNISKP